MNKVACLFVGLGTEYINLILISILVLKAKIVDINRVISRTFSVLVLHLTIYYIFSFDVANNISVITLFLVPILFLKNRKKEGMLIYPFLYSLSGIVGIVCSFGVSFIMKCPIEYVLEPGLINVVCHLGQTVFLFGVCLFSLRKEERSFEIYVEKKQCIILDIVAVISCIGVGAIQTICSGQAYVEEEIVCGLAISIVVLTMMITLIWMGISERQRIVAEERFYYSEQIASAQKEHYEQLLKKDEQDKKFRHDVRAHLRVLKTLAKRDECQNVIDYVETIENITLSSARKYSTGSDVIDAILDLFVDDIEREKIEFVIKGRIGTVKNISDMDIGIIVFNLMKNSVEASEKVEVGKRRIELLLGNYNEKNLIKISNVFNGVYTIEDGRLKTTKNDTNIHGIGMENVSLSVRRICGTFEYKIEDNLFGVEILF